MALKVLAVEDDQATLDLIYEVLSSLGVNVHPMNNSQQAARLVDQEKFDGIFLDLVMPEVDGLELTRLVRRSGWNRRTPVVMITGKEDKDTIEQAFAAGATFFLAKPIDRSKLIRLLNSTRGSMLEERRRFQRISLRTQVAYQVGDRKFTGQSSNLSQTGILFEGNGALKPGIALQFSFRLPEQPLPIEAEGVVVRVDDKGRVGVRFTQLRTEDRQRIRELVSSQAEKA